MIKPQTFQIFTGVYNRSILVCLNEPDARVYELVLDLGYAEEESLAKKVAGYSPRCVDEAYTYVFDDRNSVVRLKADEMNPVFHECVSHEMFHAAAAILDHAGIKLGSKSEEAYAYLIGYLVREFYTKLEV